MEERFEILPYPLINKDERGWVLDPFYNDKGDFSDSCEEFDLNSIYNIHIVSAEKGVIRGNHYHEKQLEFIVILGGLVEIVWQHENEDQKTKKVIDVVEPVVLRVPSYVKHSIKNIGNNTVHLVCYSKAGHIEGKDSIKVNDFHA